MFRFRLGVASWIFASWKGGDVTVSDGSFASLLLSPSARFSWFSSSHKRPYISVMEKRRSADCYSAKPADKNVSLRSCESSEDRRSDVFLSARLIPHQHPAKQLAVVSVVLSGGCCWLHAPNQNGDRAITDLTHKARVVYLITEKGCHMGISDWLSVSPQLPKAWRSPRLISSTWAVRWQRAWRTWRTEASCTETWLPGTSWWETTSSVRWPTLDWLASSG